jgi:glycosidase
VDANDPISGTFFYDEDPGVMTAPLWNWIVPDPRVVGSPWEGSYSKLFYGGDLQGILSQLDYLESLGVTVLYFNPIFEAPSNHKYDATNYEYIDDNFGDVATFLTLTQELHARGMYLVLDGVFNHTSSDSDYFDRYGRYSTVGACEDVNSPYRGWYIFTPASPPGTGVCAGDTNYQSWWGFDSLPELVTENDEVRDYIYRTDPQVATYWLDQGADGWRLDVAGDVGHAFWQDWRAYIRGAKPTAITIAEEWGDASEFMLGDELDSAMNYRFRNALIGLLRETDWQDTNSFIRALSVTQFDSLMHSFEEDYPPEAWYAMMNLVDSHDTNRVLIPLDQDGDPTDPDYADGKARLHILALIQLTMPGAPTIYYGDEVGLVGYGAANGGGVYYSDPYNRQPFPWPDEPGYGQLPAWRQQDAALLAYYSTLAGIRNAHPALRTGSFDTLLTDDANEVYAYGRKGYGEAAVVVANMGPAQDVVVDVSDYLPEGITLTDELNGNVVYTVTGGAIALPAVPQMRGAVLVAGGQDITPPAAPTNLAALEGDGAVYLSWDPVAEPATYNL